MNNRKKEREMRSAFNKEAKRIISQKQLFVRRPEDMKIGLESEIGVFNLKSTESDTVAVRDAIVAEVGGEGADVELGAFQLELRTPPIGIFSQEGLESLEKKYRSITDTAERIARKHGFSTLRCGTNPFVRIHGTPRTKKEKYVQVPDFQNVHRREYTDIHMGIRGTRVNIGDASIVSLFQSFQVNVGSSSLNDAVMLMNYAFMIGPYLMGIGGNSRYLECTDTGINDIRILSWESSHDTRTVRDVIRGMKTRIGLPERYFLGIEDYFSRVSRYPFILYAPEMALRIGIGLHWLDTRLKIIGNDAVVEFRMLPTQPFPDDEISFALAFVGRLLYAAHTREVLLPFELVKENRLSALLYGTHALVWINNGGLLERVSIKEALEMEITRAIYGLRVMGIDTSERLNEFVMRYKKNSPSEILATILDGEKNPSRETMWNALVSAHMIR
jgi:hypothetical protein